jgi:hypothetical protein
LSSIDLVDPRSGRHLAMLLPLDKEKNAERFRRPLGEVTHEPLRPSGIAPHLRALMADYAATGLPPAYVPKPESNSNSNSNSDDDNDNEES